ncbi:SDR family oxidoreductase [Streptomyces sp. NRRL_ISP-5395]|uniref:SDR family NAD(P)-dependent oxidoreductase n=1 Tax=Streptomyces TaxID=1883 RepID=UPI0018769D3A|nr:MULTISPECIES: SDR family oxidoreductase [Streptomyces]MDX2669844.1 SDR family oxidoreductase [Streptomyces sp. NRRL_ISP-5395]GHF81245.1 beta-ketoacyl-ACP reductase [Streptomyces griseus]
MDLGLSNRTVLVTGASGGMGREIAAAFGAEGADVVIGYRSRPQDADATAERVEKAGGRALTVSYDLSDPASARALVDSALAWTGRTDVLVNNAFRPFGFRPPEDRFEEVGDDWRDKVRDNVEGAIELTRLVAPSMREHGWGRIVHLSSSLVTEGVLETDAGRIGSEYYAAAKAALHGFSRSTAFGLGRDGDILSNVVVPGLTRTFRNEERMSGSFGVAERYAARAPLGRLLEAPEVARVVVFLASAANTAVTGQTIAVTGGA